MLVRSLNSAVIITLDWNVLSKTIDLVRYLLSIIYKFLSITLNTLSCLIFIKILWSQHNHCLRLTLDTSYPAVMRALECKHRGLVPGLNHIMVVNTKNKCEECERILRLHELSTKEFRNEEPI